MESTGLNVMDYDDDGLAKEYVGRLNYFFINGMIYYKCTQRPCSMCTLSPVGKPFLFLGFPSMC